MSLSRKHFREIARILGENLADDASTGEVTLQGGGAPVYGCFNKLVSATIAAGSVLIAYRG